MVFIPVPNGISLCFHFGQSGQNWQFCLTLHKAAGAPTNADLVAAAGAGHSWWTATLSGLMNQATTLVDVTATDLTSQGAPQVIDAVGTAGLNGTQLVPQSSAVVVSQRTALRGRSYRGRAYLGGLSYTQLASDVDITGAAASAISAAFGNLDTALAGLGLDVVVASRQHNKVIVNPAAINRVIAYVVDAHLDSQRRRLFGRGK